MTYVEQQRSASPFLDLKQEPLWTGQHDLRRLEGEWQSQRSFLSQAYDMCILAGWVHS